MGMRTKYVIPGVRKKFRTVMLHMFRDEMCDAGTSRMENRLPSGESEREPTETCNVSTPFFIYIFFLHVFMKHWWNHRFLSSSDKIRYYFTVESCYRRISPCHVISVFLPFTHDGAI